MTAESDTPEPEKKPPRKPGAKADRATVADRVAEILKIRLRGSQFHDCITYAQEKGWNVSERQVGRYIRAADDLLVEREDRSRKRTVARHVAMREALYAKAIEAEDLKTALAVLADLAKLKGLYASGGVLKELARLAAAQGMEIEELKRQLSHATRLDSPPPEAPGAGTGETETGDAGDGEPDGDVPG